jgi:ABC-type Co2+ transport system permease subunit
LALSEAFLPLGVCIVFLSLNLPGFGGSWFNLSNLVAVIWTVVAISYFRRQKDEKPLWLLALAPFAFALPILAFLFSKWSA